MSGRIDGPDEPPGFAIVGRLPQAFRRPSLGYVDAPVMFRTL